MRGEGGKRGGIGVMREWTTRSKCAGGDDVIGVIRSVRDENVLGFIFANYMKRVK